MLEEIVERLSRILAEKSYQRFSPVEVSFEIFREFISHYSAAPLSIEVMDKAYELYLQKVNETGSALADRLKSGP